MSFGQTESSPVNIVPAEFKEMRQPIADFILAALGSGGLRADGAELTWGGPFVAPISEQETAQIQSIIEQANRQSEQEQRAREALLPILSGESAMPESNPFLAAAIKAAQRPTLEAFEEATKGDKIYFTRAGHTVQQSSPFAQALAVRERGLASALGDIATKISAENLQQERERQLRAVEATQALDTAQMERSIQALTAAALPRLIEDLGIERGIEEFQRRMETLMAILQQAAYLAQPRTAQESSGWEMNLLGGSSFSYAPRDGEAAAAAAG